MFTISRNGCSLSPEYARDNFPSHLNTVSGLDNEPYQRPIKESPFTVDLENRRYEVNPLFDYDLHGLVVSRRQHDGDLGTHKQWDDYFNVADVCVIWGKTAKSTYLNNFSFHSGPFVCSFKTKNREAFESFNVNELSNNHLITEDEFLREKIRDVKIGDQIHISGKLAHYGQPGQSKRQTSTVRTDTGNGACETIYVTDFSIVKASSSGWRTMMYVSALSLFISLFVYVASPYKAN